MRRKDLIEFFLENYIVNGIAVTDCEVLRIEILSTAEPAKKFQNSIFLRVDILLTIAQILNP